MSEATACTRLKLGVVTGAAYATLVVAVILIAILSPRSTLAGAPHTAWPPPVPAQLILTVRETVGVARVAEVVRSGIPLPRSLNLRSTDSLTLVDAANTPAPAEFQVLARWHAGRDDVSAPIQWLLVTFPATVTANSSSTYRLVTDGSAGPNPPPAQSLTLVQNGDQITIHTGAAIFSLGGAPDALFDEVRLADNTRLGGGGGLSAVANGTVVGHPTTRRIQVEHAGPLVAVVVVEGAYALPAIGGGGLGSFRRYVFTAGSPTAVVRQAVAWEGDLCPGDGADLTCGDTLNGLLLTNVRDTLALDLAAPLAVTALGDFQAAAVTGTANAGQSASVRQLLRPNRTAPLAFSVNVPGSVGAATNRPTAASWP